MTNDNRNAIRDPIHGLITRERDEIRLMNTAAFQRLRRVRQLALAHLLYPSALQTRFEHSLGTMHVAGRIAGRLEELGEVNADGIRLIRLTGLLHDIGHGPFSHVSEYLLDRFYDRGAIKGLGSAAKIHEKITVDIILQDPEISEILGEDTGTEIAALIAGTEERRFERDIVSSQLDADKMDYLLRDSYFAGVEYGRFDLDKIVDVCRVHKAAQESYLAFDVEGIYAIEQLVLAKHHMSQQVYFHRIRAITDAMLVRGLSLAVAAGVEPAVKLYTYDGSPEFVENYVKFHDEHVIQLLAECTQENVREIFTRLIRRKLLKQVCRFPVDEVDDVIQRDRLSRLRFESDESKALEAVVADELGAKHDLVIVTRQSIKNPTFRTRSYQLGEEEIIILDSEGIPRKISEFPDLIFDLNTRASSRETLMVFAPQDDWTDAETSDDERAETHRRVRELILEAA